MDLCLSLTWYWSMIGANSESRIWLEFALAADGADGHPDWAYAEGARAVSRIASGEMSGPGGWDDARDELRQIAARLAAAPPPRVAALAVLAPMLGYFGGDNALAESLIGTDPAVAGPVGPGRGQDRPRGLRRERRGHRPPARRRRGGLPGLRTDRRPLGPVLDPVQPWAGPDDGRRSGRSDGGLRAGHGPLA